MWLIPNLDHVEDDPYAEFVVNICINEKKIQFPKYL